MSTNLQEIQRRMAACVMQPLTRDEGMRRRNAGVNTESEAAAIIAPNDRLSSFERLEIYNRQYWFRLWSAFEEDFPGLASVVGAQRFGKLMRAYLEECPSRSFTLRNLGSNLGTWLRENPSFTGPRHELALDMAALEWAHIRAFDEAALPRITPEALASVSAESRLALQPHLQLLECHYPVDDALIAVRSDTSAGDASSNSAFTGHTAKKLRALRTLPREQIYLAIHRHDDTVYYRRLVMEDFRLLQSLRNGATLDQAIDDAFRESALPELEQPAHLQSAFTHFAAIGWFCNRSDDTPEGIA